MPGYEALGIFGTPFAVGLSGALAPGPLLALDVREATRGGFWAGPYIATGHSLLELLVVILLAVGLLDVIQEDPAFTVIALSGGSSSCGWDGGWSGDRPTGYLIALGTCIGPAVVLPAAQSWVASYSASPTRTGACGG